MHRPYVPARVMLDGHDLESLDVHWLREQIGTVSQHPAIFHGTVFGRCRDDTQLSFIVSPLDNIHFGALDATREQVEHAAAMANVRPII
jgi:ATP-binding cassette subfamily B (MDR/TAP) protein 1